MFIGKEWLIVWLLLQYQMQIVSLAESLTEGQNFDVAHGSTGILDILLSAV